MDELNYNFYVEVFKGDAVPDNAAFEKLQIEATAFVDRLVLDRSGLEFEAINKRYKLAICSVIDDIYINQNQGIKSSESVGNHSVSYVTRSAPEIQADRKSKALTYLASSGLLTRAVM